MRAGAVGIALGCLCFLLTLEGCGGGGSLGSSSMPPRPSDSVTPNPTPTASPSLYAQPDGTTLVYAGILTQTFQSFPEVVAPGTPSPMPTSATVENVTQNVTVKTNQSFNGASGLFDLHSAETDAYASGLKTTTSTTDTYETLSQSGSASQLLGYGSQFADESGDTITTEYAPQTILDQLPQTAGAQWSNGPGATVLEALAGNTAGSAITVDRTVHSDGTYSENTTYPPSYAAPGYTGVGQIQENTDGSGTFAWVANAGAITIEYSRPVPQPTGPPQITVAVFAGLDPTPANKPNSSFQLNSWYGSAPAFYSEADRDLGTVAVPASCALSTQLPQQATAIAQTIDRTDAVLGYTEHQVTTTYVTAGYGTLCTAFQDTQTLYYDFNGDQPFVFTSKPPLEIATVTETLSLQPSPQTSSSVTGTRTQSASTQTAALNLSASLRGRFDRAVSLNRQNRVQSMFRAAQYFHSKGAQ